jgi:hypothetical protein
MKNLFLMTPVEYTMFTESCNPPALLVVMDGRTPSWNKFEHAERFWRAMGEAYGFLWETVEPCVGMHVAYYRATPAEALAS